MKIKLITKASLIIKPYRFSIAKWESVVIPYEVDQWIFNRYERNDDEVYIVTEYFSSIKRIKTLKLEIQAINPSTLVVGRMTQLHWRPS